MSVTVTDIIDNVFVVIGEKDDALTGLISRTDVLVYFNAAKRRLSRYIPVVTADTNIQAIDDQIVYDLPPDYKANLYRVEYNYLPLVKADYTTLDEYDKNWRNSALRSPPDSSPQYFLPKVSDGDEFVIYPPPSSSGGAGPPIPAEDNFRLYYEKHFVDISTETDATLETELEKYQEAIEDWMIASVFKSGPKENIELANLHFDLFAAEVRSITGEKDRTRPQINFTVKRKDGFGYGRRERGRGRRRD